MSINARDLRKFIIKPALVAIDLYSPEAEELVLATAIHESEMGFYLHQVEGPALGIYQMEPQTYVDCYDNFLKFNPRLLDKILSYLKYSELPEPARLISDLSLATIMCRIKYFRAPARLPSNINDIYGLAHYWKQYYNTELGSGTVDKFVKSYSTFIN